VARAGERSKLTIGIVAVPIWRGFTKTELPLLKVAGLTNCFLASKNMDHSNGHASLGCARLIHAREKGPSRNLQRNPGLGTFNPASKKKIFREDYPGQQEKRYEAI
jgi:hypothetical protein